MQSGGGSWRTYSVTRAQVLARMAPIEATLPQVWPFVLDIVDRFCALGAIVG
jgi:putative hydrolase of HD superfamily